MTGAAPPRWLADSVLYQIYPQSFADSNSDGIGDLAGIVEQLDHLEWLGVTTLWLTPCFASPFTDAGYDVADHLRVAPRYGGDEDLVALFEAAHPWHAGAAGSGGRTHLRPARLVPRLGGQRRRGARRPVHSSPGVGDPVSPLLARGARLAHGAVSLDSFGYGVWKLGG